jgi:hypothetical protein
MALCHLSVTKATQAAPHRRQFVQAFEIVLFSIRLFKRTYHFGSVFPYRLNLRIYEIKFPTNNNFFPLPFFLSFFIFYFSSRFNFSLGAQNLPFIRE